MDLDDDLVARLVQEAALEYYSPEQISQQMGVPPATVTRLLSLPGVQARVANVRRTLIEEGSRFSTLARRLADDTLPQIALIVNDPEASAADKLKAFDLMVRFSGLAPKEDKTPQGVTINLTAILDQAAQRAAPFIDLTALPPKEH